MPFRFSRKTPILCLFTITSTLVNFAQVGDSLFGSTQNKHAEFIFEPSTLSPKKSFLGKRLFFPSLMIAYGLVGIESDGLQSVNDEFKENLWTENPHKRSRIDNYLQFAPAITVYGLNALGIKGKNNFRDRTMIYLMSNVFMTTAVYSMKKMTNQLRPDGSSYLSFPSGHTAEAFASAEFLRREYKEVSPWYGVAGYAAAVATGFFRMYNNKHWLSDVVTGAGVGIASTRLAYWLYPLIKEKIFKARKSNLVVMPYHFQKSTGICLVTSLN